MDRYEYLKKLVEEKKDLDEKIESLEGFIKSASMPSYNKSELFCPLRILVAQKDAMTKYSFILDERIHCVDI